MKTKRSCNELKSLRSKYRAEEVARQVGNTPRLAERRAKDSAASVLTIEWKHLDRSGKTCDRCGDTGDALRKTLRHLRRRCRPSGVAVKLFETKLPTRRLQESNAIHFNGVPLEEALGDAEVRASECGSCSALVGEASDCRSVQRGGKTYEAIPEELLREAACRVAGCPCPEESASRLSA